MTREKIFADVQEIFRDVFDDESLEIGDETNSGDIEDWDSLFQIRLTVAIEKHFKIKFALGEPAKWQNVGEMVDAILQKV